MGSLSVRELLAAYAERSLSPVEVVAACAARIEEDRLGAWRALCLERAAAEAREAEAAWLRDSTPGPLCGVPLAVKDLFDTAGIETACGSALMAGRVPEADAKVVRRARAAGAIVLGKTSTHEFACGLTMVNEHLGDTRNPFDPARTPGGSSGGSAVALATGMAPLALGTDTGGSIRWPAAACGVAGLKPTYGLVSLEGCWPLAPTLDHVGPMARSPEDLALLLAVIANWRPAAVEGPLVVGLPTALPVDLAAPVATALARAADALRQAGNSVVEVEAIDWSLAVTTFFGVFHWEILQTHRGFGFWPSRADEYTANVRARLEIAEGVSEADYAAACALREVLREQARALFDRCDVLLTPVCAAPVPRLDDLGAIREIVTPLTCPQDVLGLPACAVPAGIDENGVPIGVQFTGPPGSESVVLAAASASSARPVSIETTGA